MTATLSKISRDLKLVVPIEGEDGSVSYVHAVPLSEAAYGANWQIIMRAWSTMMNNSASPDAAVRAAPYALRDAAVALYGEGRAEEKRTALINEVMRGATFISASPDGFRPAPYYNAVKNGAISSDDARDVEGVLVFFILVSANLEPKRRAVFLNGLKYFVDASVVSLSSTEYVNSLQTQKRAEISGESKAAL